MKKSQIIEAFTEKIKSEYEAIKVALEETRTSTQTETKSSAGDKYETQREMIQLEINRMESQLVQLESTLRQWQSFKEESSTITWGSFVKIEMNGNAIHLLIGPSSGDVNIDGQVIKSISKDSPIGSVLWGRTSNDNVSFSNKTIRIISCS